MNFLKRSIWRKLANSTRIFFPGAEEIERHRLENFPSRRLKRPVVIDLLLPPGYFDYPGQSYPLLLLNDGQDLEALNLPATLSRLLAAGRLRPFVTAAVHAGDRMQEYGAAGRPDYQKRGRKATAYTAFIRSELLPALHRRYRLRREAAANSIAGCSLGGLSALDIAWQNPDLFGQVGVFSGALWWRSRPFRADDPDADRIMHTMVARGPKRAGMRFWLQAGTHDETADRNNNGVIDAIDDTLDLIKELESLSYRRGEDIRYVEVAGGEHHPQTWGKIMPDFLKWAYGRRRS